MLSRRAVIGKLAAGTAAVCAVGVAGTSAASVGGTAPAPTGGAGGTGPAAPRMSERVDVIDADAPVTGSAPPWELLRPLTVGAAVGHGWHVAELSGVADGSCVLTLGNARGRTHRVHLCGNDGHPQGVVHTARFDMVVMNGGQGDLPTEEGLAQAVAAVAHVVAANEDDRRKDAVVAALMPHGERVRLFAGPVDRRLR